MNECIAFYAAALPNPFSPTAHINVNNGTTQHATGTTHPAPTTHPVAAWSLPAQTAAPPRPRLPPLGKSFFSGIMRASPVVSRKMAMAQNEKSVKMIPCPQFF